MKEGAIRIELKKSQLHVNMQFHVKSFNELTLNEFHSILLLRINVFVVEQDCPYPELDNKDQKAFHLFAFSEDNSDKVIAYTRIFKPGDYYQEAALGRVAVHGDYRNQQLGYELIKKSIKVIKTKFNTSNIKIGAQTYLKNFYGSFGFKQEGDEYIEDGIPHIHMIRN